MTDISARLTEIMRKENCSSIYAFYLLGGVKDEPNDELPKYVCKTNKHDKLGARYRGSESV